MENVINLDLLANPINWIIIFLVMYFLLLSGHAIYSSASGYGFPIPNVLKSN